MLILCKRKFGIVMVHVVVLEYMVPDSDLSYTYMLVYLQTKSKRQNELAIQLMSNHSLQAVANLYIRY